MTTPCNRKTGSVRLVSIVASGFMLTAGTALADSGDPLNFSVGGQIRYEDNLFRLPQNLVVPGIASRSDQLRLDYAGIAIDKSYSQQRLKLDVTASQYRYQTFSQLNFQAVDYHALWMWHLTQRLSGNLGVDRKVSQSNFADTRNFAGVNTLTTDNRRFDADWWLHGSWHLTGGVSERTSRNSQISREQDSFRERGADVGVRYVAPSGSSATLVTRQTRGAFDERILNAVTLLDTGYSQNDLELRLSWLLSGKSTLRGRVTRLERRHDNFGQRDFGGTGGQFDYVFTPTGKIQMTLSAIRNIASYQEATNSYYVDDKLVFAPIWQVDSKTSVRLNLERGQRDFLGGATAPPAVPRSDQTESAQLSLAWSPVRAIVLTLSVQHDRRRSNNQNFDFRNNATGLAADISF